MIDCRSFQQGHYDKVVPGFNESQTRWIMNTNKIYDDRWQHGWILQQYLREGWALVLNEKSKHFQCGGYTPGMNRGKDGYQIIEKSDKHFQRIRFV